jgi:hypothetical protein
MKLNSDSQPFTVKIPIDRWFKMFVVLVWHVWLQSFQQLTISEGSVGFFFNLQRSEFSKAEALGQNLSSKEVVTSCCNIYPPNAKDHLRLWSGSGTAVKCISLLGHPLFTRHRSLTGERG